MEFLGEPRIWPVFFKVKGYLANLFPIVRFGFTSREGIQDHEFWALATHLHLRGTLHQGLFTSLHLYIFTSLHRIFTSYHLLTVLSIIFHPPISGTLIAVPTSLVSRIFRQHLAYCTRISSPLYRMGITTPSPPGAGILVVLWVLHLRSIRWELSF
ncbi:unnamed protein product [Callosobruchus maculatus]|uniref:Uncharacterized protein n=1 Tax=Callosobruchus maculatus TaxID=64391 RepID=A0A653CYE5_CALMS|nr:unnamed protein product [Callosobruchus maculatus]